MYFVGITESSFQPSFTPESFVTVSLLVGALSKAHSSIFQPSSSALSYKAHSLRFPSHLYPLSLYKRTLSNLQVLSLVCLAVQHLFSLRPVLFVLFWCRALHSVESYTLINEPSHRITTTGLFLKRSMPCRRNGHQVGHVIL
jgi:hypothetical protein